MYCTVLYNIVQYFIVLYLTRLILRSAVGVKTAITPKHLCLQYTLHYKLSAALMCSGIYFTEHSTI